MRYILTKLIAFHRMIVFAMLATAAAGAAHSTMLTRLSGRAPIEAGEARP